MVDTYFLLKNSRVCIFLIQDIRVKISTSKSLAIHYLERKLPGVTDPYQVAIVTHALLEAGSIEAEVGFNKLDLLKREKGKYTKESYLLLKMYALKSIVVSFPVNQTKIAFVTV